MRIFLVDKMEEKKKPVVNKYMLAFGFIAPFLFSIGGMVIAYLIAKNWSTKNRSIALIVATFIGLFVAIGSIFLIQRRINVKLKKNNS